ncbi:hypothetical protein F2Q70_00031374 [Brassica cretica]|uniref:Uncharacterized protein n=1 Tax=Brassica cretica TaxID=69181 RepID=A0A8S9FIY8_BRACR|nr:hypothetical protein F2Q70_00031374 [Brassica cretica]
MGSMENVHSSASDSLIWGFSIISIVMTKLIFHVYMVEIVDQEEARILLQWHVLYKAYVEEEAKLKVGAAANQQEKQTKEEVGLEVSVTPSGSTMFLTLVLETKKMASAASSLSAKERREQAAAARGTTLSNSGSSEKSQLGSMGKTGQIFTPHIVNIASGEIMFTIPRLENVGKTRLQTQS